MPKLVRSVESKISALRREAFWGLTSEFKFIPWSLRTRRNRKFEPQEFDNF